MNIEKNKKINYNQKDLLDHHAIGAVIKNKKGRILMQEHIKSGFWTIPGGKVEENQSVEEGLKQEVLEECNLIVEDFKELINKKYSYNRNGKNVKVWNHVFEISKYKGTLRNNEPHKHRKQIFLSLEKIKKLSYLSDSTLLYLMTLGFKREAHL